MEAKLLYFIQASISIFNFDGFQIIDSPLHQCMLLVLAVSLLFLITKRLVSMFFRKRTNKFMHKLQNWEKKANILPIKSLSISNFKRYKYIRYLKYIKQHLENEKEFAVEIVYDDIRYSAEFPDFNPPEKEDMNYNYMQLQRITEEIKEIEELISKFKKKTVASEDISLFNKYLDDYILKDNVTQEGTL